jgi:hypothetical protein
MYIFNFKFICKDNTLVDKVQELNTYTFADASQHGLNPVHGIEFFLRTENNRTFYIVQCEDEHLVYFVPDGRITREQYKLVYSHNTYEEVYDRLDHYASFSEVIMLRNLWLYSVDGSNRYNTDKCLGVS